MAVCTSSCRGGPWRRCSARSAPAARIANPAAAPSPAPEQEAVTPQAPESPAERLMAGLWSAVLGIENPGVTDDWFALGGDSIQSLQLVARARAAGLKLTTRQILEHPRIADLARLAVPISETSDLPAAPAADPPQLPPPHRGAAVF